ncbi:MAG TPA: toll/interleukin-1 receptor domain-containing protein [Solirubrobacterales bacterium]|jgi:hypothetical protein|nr:toll/interleukin-1 receptor domain-containing protein [Solirubrobacterales bacterium]
MLIIDSGGLGTMGLALSMPRRVRLSPVVSVQLAHDWRTARALDGNVGKPLGTDLDTVEDMAGAAGFLSYVRKDDDGDHGRILAFANDLREQYRIQTAEPLELFVDRESIQWGEAWEQRIDSAIAGTTFFIPIVTPSYFQSQACRQELLKFVREAERLGLEQLLMSVYWVTVPELEDEPELSTDEAIRVVAKYNWQDLREESFEERDSAIYRKAVREIARELGKRADLARKVGDIPVSHIATDTPIESSSEANEPPGIIESFVTTEDQLPRAGSLLQKIGEEMDSINSMMEGFGDKAKGASSRGQGMKAVLTLTNRLAQEMSEPASEIANAGHEYGQVLAELDPAVHTQIDMMEAEDGLPVEHREYLEQIVGLVAAAQEAQPGFESVVSGAESAATFSRSLRAPLSEMKGGVRGVLDGNAVIEAWGSRAAELLAGNKLPSDEADDESSSS